MVTWVDEGLCCETGEMREIGGRGEVTEVSGDRRGTVSGLVQRIAGNREVRTSLANHLQRPVSIEKLLVFVF